MPEVGMQGQPNFDEFAAVVAEVFLAERSQWTRATTAKDVDGWDSVSHLILIATIEEHYGVQFDLADLQNLADLGALHDKVAGLVAARAG
jgi:acyl carrier protein